MFDISFAELLMIAVVALLVIGPDKLPQVARTVGKYVGHLQRYVAQVKEEINREARFEDLQNLQQEIKQGVNKVESSIMAGTNEAQRALTSAQEAVKSKRKSPVKNAPAKQQTAKRKSTKKARVRKPSAKKTSDKQAEGKV